MRGKKRWIIGRLMNRPIRSTTTHDWWGNDGSIMWWRNDEPTLVGWTSFSMTAARYATREQAQSVALLMTVKNPELVQKLFVVQLPKKWPKSERRQIVLRKMIRRAIPV